METTIIKIGNSRGIIIPAALLKNLNINVKDKVYLEMKDNELHIKLVKPREGWDKMFKEEKAKSETNT